MRRFEIAGREIDIFLNRMDRYTKNRKETEKQRQLTCRNVTILISNEIGEVDIHLCTNNEAKGTGVNYVF